MQATDIPHPISEMESELLRANQRALDLRYQLTDSEKENEALQARIEKLEGWLKEERANFLVYLWRLKENKPSHGDPDYEPADKDDLEHHLASRTRKTELSKDVARKQLIAEQKLEAPI